MHAFENSLKVYHFIQSKRKKSGTFDFSFKIYLEVVTPILTIKKKARQSYHQQFCWNPSEN